jgi:hypothetical protein
MYICLIPNKLTMKKLNVHLTFMSAEQNHLRWNKVHTTISYCLCQLSSRLWVIGKIENRFLKKNSGEKLIG